jgi:hypothetical protein
LRDGSNQDGERLSELKTFPLSWLDVHVISDR